MSFDPTDDPTPEHIHGWKVCCTFDDNGTPVDVFTDQVTVEEYTYDNEGFFYYEGEEVREVVSESTLTAYEGYETTFEFDRIYITKSESQALAAAKLDCE
jgi:hypothetical protein